MIRSRLVRGVLVGLGTLLVLVAPLVGVIPGPGGILVFAAGMALLLRNSALVRRWFVRAGRRWPRLRDLADRALRRPSVRRRRARKAGTSR